MIDSRMSGKHNIKGREIEQEMFQLETWRCKIEKELEKVAEEREKW